jgi:2,4-diketo-3-deoxy-L-fuconate hydrolase
MAGAAPPDSLARLRGLNIESFAPGSRGTCKGLTPGACVGQVGKFICIGLNYSDHAAESGMPVRLSFSKQGPAPLWPG